MRLPEQSASATSSSIRSASFKTQSFPGESIFRRTPKRLSVSCGRRNPPPASAATAPAPNNRTSRRVRYRKRPGVISIAGRDRSSKKPRGFFMERDPKTTDEAAPSDRGPRFADKGDPVERISSGCNELLFLSLLTCDGLRALHTC